MLGEQVCGVVTLYSQALNAFHAEDLHMMLGAAPIFVSVLANATQTKTPSAPRKIDFPAQTALAVLVN
jgi:hypothetical protein